MTKVIQSTYEFWKDADFSKVLKDLDNIAAEITESKDENELSRKLLFDKNRKFKEQVSLETRQEVGPLIRCFQTEVDSLSKRNKSLETNILILYKKLIDLPDPIPAFEQALAGQKKIQKYQDILLENKKLRESLEEYQKEFSDIKNQEVTINNLKDRIKELESKMNSNIELKFKEKEKDLLLDYNEKEREIMGEKIELIEKVKELENKLSNTELSLSNSQSDLFQAKIKLDDYSSAKTSEIELLLSENDRMTERIKQLENQLTGLRNEKQSLLEEGELSKSGSNASRIDLNDLKEREINDLHAELILRQSEITKLGEENRKAHILFVKSENQLKYEIEALQDTITSQQEEIMKWKQKLESRNDYDELKRELEVIKSIEFSELVTTNQNDELSSVTNQKKSTSKSLEQLLMEKNRQMQSELVREKVNHEAVKVKLSEMTDKYSELNRLFQEKENLINTLEDDLNNVKSYLPKSESGKSHESNLFNAADSEVVGLNNQMTSSSEILSYIVDMDINEMDDKINSQDIESKQKSLLAIVQSQRDRFKQRSQDLENMLSTFQLQMKSQEDEVERVKHDNVKLYEKIRFLQSNTQTYTSPDDSVLSQYSNDYEQRLNPFEKFSRRERSRQYNILPIHEKVMYSLGKFVMGNRIARLFAFLYTILLHFLIFIVLYKLASSETYIRAQALACERKYSDHMIKEHGKH